MCCAATAVEVGVWTSQRPHTDGHNRAGRISDECELRMLMKQKGPAPMPANYKASWQLWWRSPGSTIPLFRHWQTSLWGCKTRRALLLFSSLSIGCFATRSAMMYKETTGILHFLQRIWSLGMIRKRGSLPLLYRNSLLMFWLSHHLQHWASHHSAQSKVIWIFF